MAKKRKITDEQLQKKAKKVNKSISNCNLEVQLGKEGTWDTLVVLNKKSKTLDSYSSHKNRKDTMDTLKELEKLCKKKQNSSQQAQNLLRGLE